MSRVVRSRVRVLVLAIVSGLLLLPWSISSASAAPPTDTSPSKISVLRSGTTNYVFGKSSSANSIVYRNIAANNSWKTIPGTTSIVSGPSAVINGSQAWVFATGSNGQLYYTKTSDFTTWSAWSSLGGSFVGSPAAVTGSPTRNNSLAVAGRNTTDGTYSFRYLQGATWSSWYSAGPEVYTTSPALTLPFGVPGDFGAWNLSIAGVKSPGASLFEVGFSIDTGTIDPGPSRVASGGFSGATNARSTLATNAQGRDGFFWYRTTTNTLSNWPNRDVASGSVLSTPGVATSGVNNWICVKATTAGAVSCTTQTLDLAINDFGPYAAFVSLGGAVA